MDQSSIIQGTLDICDSQMQGWSVSYVMKSQDLMEAQADFLTLCRYRAACLATGYSLVNGYVEFAQDERPAVPVIEEPLTSPWKDKALSLCQTLKVAVECQFRSARGQTSNCLFHALGRSVSRAQFLPSVREVYPADAIPSPDGLTSPEEAFRALLAFVRDKTLFARVTKSKRIVDTAPWINVTVKDIDFDNEPELTSIKKKEFFMLPTLASVHKCKTLKILRLGAIQLYFELPRDHDTIPSYLLGFVIDGQAPCICQRASNRVVADKYLSSIEPDRSKWLPEPEFGRRWLEISKRLLSP